MPGTLLPSRSGLSLDTYTDLQVRVWKLVHVYVLTLSPEAEPKPKAKAKGVSKAKAKAKRGSR